MTIDANGRSVLAFGTKVRNLFRVSELTASIVEMGRSGVWRDYRTGTGHDQWREAEFDYFLIAWDIPFEDAARVLAWNADGVSLAPLMDRSANGERRRPLAEAATSWHAPAAEGLVERARRLGWLTETGRSKVPVSSRAQVQAKHGMTKDQLARLSRAERIPAPRRRQLDSMAHDLTQKLEDDERRYLVDRLRQSDPGGRRRETKA